MVIKSITKPWQPYSIIWLVFIFASFSCTAPMDEAQEIVDKSIQAHGGRHYNHVLISFIFRDRAYSVKKNDGKFTYTREFQDSLGIVRDVLDNKGLTRYINNEKVSLSDEWRDRYANSVNGVIYFALLPFPLNDKAVIKEYIGETTIKGIPFHKIKVTFKKSGGGADHTDTYIYWIHKEDFTIGYLAYEYETDGGGSRFREAINSQRVGGILFLDYRNYEPIEDIPIENYDKLFEDGKFKEISVIALEQINVSHL